VCCFHFIYTPPACYSHPFCFAFSFWAILLENTTALHWLLVAPHIYWPPLPLHFYCHFWACFIFYLLHPHINLSTPVFTSYTSIIANLAPLPHLFHILLYTPFFFFISHPCFNSMLRVPLIFTNLAPLPHLFHVYFMHSHIYFTHPACLLCAPPISYNSHPLCFCFSFLGLCLCITRCAFHITHAPYYCFFLSFCY